MAAQNLSRKRPAPGSEAVGYPQMMQQPVGQYDHSLGPQLSNDEFLRWGQAAPQAQNGYQDQSGYGLPQQSYQSNNIPVSNQLARRPMNPILTRPAVNGDQWGQDPNVTTNPTAMNAAWEDDVDDLEQKAQAAKRDASAKRKQIPPFVLKLRSFVENPENDDLIRWTEDGKSFVVLDEDEFAKKLIPELFKHNNYASFVRQLNMYGFHKKVGLSDNSMRASERKSKSPSEYSNPYFRQGHPDLMWLIQKPKNVTATSKGKARTKVEGDAGDEPDEIHEEPNTETRVKPRPQLALGDGSANGLMKETLYDVRHELRKIKEQQARISQMVAHLNLEQQKMYSEAMEFKDQHKRHENSINAILTFLATIYNRSLSGNDAAQSIANMFSSSLPQNTDKSGTVVDVGDYNFDQFPGLEELGNKPFKKPQLLLTDGQNRATTMSPASNRSPAMRQSRLGPQQPSANSPQVQEVYDNSSDFNSPNNTVYNQNALAGNGQRNQQDMMSIIEKANARNPSPKTPVADFTHALNDLENSQGNSPLTDSQRDNVLRMMNNSANQGGDNALVNASTSSGPTNFNNRLQHAKSDLDTLARMQAQQDQSVEKLTNLLQPLSPSGSIPGINDGQSLPPPPLDIENFLSHNDFFTDFPSDGNGNLDFTNHNNGTFNWDAVGDDDDELFADVDNNSNIINDTNMNQNGYGDSNNFLHAGAHDGGGRVESVASSEVTTPKHSSIGGDDEFNNSSKGKGRKLSVIDEPNNKKRRRS